VWGSKKAAGLFESPPSNNYYKNSNAYKPNNEMHAENVLPSEKIIIYRETSKLYAFCADGSLASFKVLYKNFKTQNIAVKKAYMKQILYSIIYAETLIQSSKDGIDALNSLRESLIDEIKNESSKDVFDRELLDLYWKIIIIGWPVLVRTTEHTFEVLSLII
jgi:hypothetical protein